MQLSFPRGTTFSFLVKLKDEDGNAKQLVSGEKLILGVKHYVENKNYLISKTLTSANYDETKGGYVFTINPGDTSSFSFDDYYYDIAYYDANGALYQVAPVDKMTIEKAIVKYPEA